MLINVPVYLMPDDFLKYYEPNFLMLQLYYLFCGYSRVKIENQIPQ